MYCGKCKHQFATKYTFNRHMNTKHNDDNSLELNKSEYYELESGNSRSRIQKREDKMVELLKGIFHELKKTSAMMKKLLDRQKSKKRLLPMKTKQRSIPTISVAQNKNM